MEMIKLALLQSKIDFILDFDVSEISTIKISQKIELAIFPKNVKELCASLKILNRLKQKFKVVGNVSNILFVERIEFPIIFTCKMKDEYKIDKNEVTVSAGMQISRLIELCKRSKLGGIEGLVGIPATIGGAIFNNAGAYGFSISSCLKKISAFYNGKVIDVPASEIKFGYHFSNLKGIVILTASFWFENKNEYDIISLCNEYTYKRTMMQPSGFSLGSVYQKINGKSAGFYIERAALKMKRIGGIVVSKKHANFFVNDKLGTAEDFCRLQELVENKVCRQFGLSLISEIEKVGDNYETSCGSSHTFK